MSNPKEKLKKFLTENGIVETSKITGLPYSRIIQEFNLGYKTFEDINFKPHPMGEGVVGVISFDNGYGASIVQTDYSYGGRLGLYELAVLDKDGHITYNTPITEDVIGYLNHEKVTEKLIEIQDLKN
jgi:hypothetical protein